MRAIFVNVEPHDYALRVDAQGHGALVRKLVEFRASTRDVERSHATVSGPQEAMISVMAVVKGSGDHLRRGNSGGKREYTARIIGRCIECDEGTAAGPHEDTKIAPEGVSRIEFLVGSRDYPVRGDI